MADSNDPTDRKNVHNTTSNAAAANDDASEPHGNPNEKLNENSPMDTTIEQRGDMTPEEYTNQPESNTNASVTRDVDPSRGQDTDEVRVGAGSPEEQHAQMTQAKQNQKLESNTKPGEDATE